MNTNIDLDRQLRLHFESSADRTVRDGQLAWVLEEVRRRSQRPGWLAGLRSPTMSAETIALAPVTARRSLAPALVLGLVVVLILGAFFAAGAGPFKGGPTNGRIVFGRTDEARKTFVYTVNPDGTHLIKLHDTALACPAYWSPDGSRITVTSASMNADGTDFRQITGRQVDGTTVVIDGVTLLCGVWTPDGASLAAAAWSDGDPTLAGIYRFRASDGADLRRMTTPPAGDDVPIGYSPDGSTLAFIGGEGFTDTEFGTLMLVNADGTNRRHLSGLAVSGGDWAPDGRSILVQTANRLYSIDVATEKATPIFITAEPDADLGNPQWSPDGTRILFTRWVDKDPKAGTQQSELFTMLADGTDVVRVTNDPDLESFADWGTSPILK